MPSRTRKNAEQPAEPPPASKDPPPVAGRTRRGGRSSPPAPPALTTAQNASSGEPDRGLPAYHVCLVFLTQISAQPHTATQPVARRTPATTGTHRDVINTGQHLFCL
jgi:hypothetical protein